MQTIYKVFNPTAGVYHQCGTQEDANNMARELAWQFYMTHTHGAPISKVTVTDAGEEIWSSEPTPPTQTQE